MGLLDLFRRRKDKAQTQLLFERLEKAAFPGGAIERQELVERVHAHLRAKLSAVECEQLGTLRFNILLDIPEYLMGMLEHASERALEINPVAAEALVDEGRKHIMREDWDELRQVIFNLWDLLPQEQRQAPSLATLTGIV